MNGSQQSCGLTRRRLLQAASLAVSTTALPRAAQAQIATLNEAINKAGRQRMLSQRMAKAWLALGLGLDARRAEKVLFDSMAWFDRQFVELKAYAPTRNIQETYEDLELTWADYKQALVGMRAEREAVTQVLSLDAKVLRLAHQGTVQLEMHYGRPSGRLVNIAGRQRMLSQRAAKFYLSQSWGASVPGALQELRAAREEFTAALDTLAQAPETTTAIHERLALARQQWVFFDTALERVRQDSGRARRAGEVFAASENILQVMDQITGLYSRLA